MFIFVIYLLFSFLRFKYKTCKPTLAINSKSSQELVDQLTLLEFLNEISKYILKNGKGKKMVTRKKICSL